MVSSGDAYALVTGVWHVITHHHQCTPQVYPAVLSRQLQVVSGGGLLQLWVEVHYMEAATARFADAQVSWGRWCCGWRVCCVVSW